MPCAPTDDGGLKATMEPEIASWQRGEGRRLLERVGVSAGATVLDFGSREGNYATAAAHLVGPEGTVYALDKDSKALDGLADRLAAEGIRNVVRVQTSGDPPLPLEDASVDVVLAYDVIHLIGWRGGESGETVRRSTASDRRPVLAELARVCRPSAVLSIYCPHLDTHTDVDAEEDIIDEVAGQGFHLRDGLHAQLVHDSKMVRGHIMNFAKASAPATARNRPFPMPQPGHN